jgi:hypothetical protein
MIASSLYKTSDICLASFLLSSGVELKDVDRGDPWRVTFIFAEPDDSLLLEWAKGTAIANVISLFSSYQTIKKNIFSQY